MKFDTGKLTKPKVCLEGPATLIADEETAMLVPRYKAEVCKNFISLGLDQIDTRLGGTKFWVTRKYDGELAVIFYGADGTFIINTGNRVRTGLPCTEAAGQALKAAGVKEAVIPAELYVQEENGRTRIFDVLGALSEQDNLDSLRLAPFDILSLDGESFKAGAYSDIHEKLTAVFGSTDYCRPVRCQAVESKNEVKDLFNRWVTEEGGEGLVVRSDLTWVYKVKPRHSIDAAVIGFSEGTAENKGQVRSLLLALMPEEGVYQIIGHSGTGFADELRKELFAQFTPLIIPSKYIETDSNHVAFHMIKPGIVIELSVGDVLFESSAGAIMNPQLELTESGWRRLGSVPGISIVFPVFERMREDKTANAQDVRLQQVHEFAYNPEAGSAGVQELTPSTLLRREVYQKTQKEKLMVQKFFAWKTNKEASGEYPAYVLSYINFSSERSEPLKAETRVSSDEGQILELMDELIFANVKKGWVKV